MPVLGICALGDFTINTILPTPLAYLTASVRMEGGGDFSWFLLVLDGNFACVWLQPFVCF